MKKTPSSITVELEKAIDVTKKNIQHTFSFASKCGKSRCQYCKRLKSIQGVFTKTKILLEGIISSLYEDSTPKKTFEKHPRKEYGNYNGWISPDGEYIDVWNLGGHDRYFELFPKKKSLKFEYIKVHASGHRSEIIFYDDKKTPTENQMGMLREIFADAMINDFKITFSFAYDPNHPDPLDLPF